MQPRIQEFYHTSEKFLFYAIWSCSSKFWSHKQQMQRPHMSNPNRVGAPCAPLLPPFCSAQANPTQPQSIPVECFHSCDQLVVVWPYLAGCIANCMVYFQQRGQAVVLCSCRIKPSKSKPFPRSSVDIAIIILQHLKHQQVIQLTLLQGGWHVNQSHY
jgi:hypothetical protein